MTSSEKKLKSMGGRQPSAYVRRRCLENGAFIIEFDEPPSPMDRVLRDLPVGIAKDPVLSDQDWQSVVKAYRTMERKGFRVTKDTGCLLPDAQYSTYQAGATFKGHQRSFGFFARWYPTMKSPVVDITRNCDLQISHLCHRRECCRIDHLIAEERWRNLKRNFCGASGECDCGNLIKCVRRYQSEGSVEEDVELCTSADQIRQVLSEAPNFVIRPTDYYTHRDAVAASRRAENQKKRERRTSKHQHQTAKRQAKLARKQ